MSSHGVGPDSEQGSVLGSGIDIESLPPEITKADLFIARKFNDTFDVIIWLMCTFSLSHNQPMVHSFRLLLHLLPESSKSLTIRF